MKTSVRMLATGGARAWRCWPPRAAASCGRATSSTKACSPTRTPSTKRRSTTSSRRCQLDPSLLNARLYLATAFAQQYIPGVDTPRQQSHGREAIDQYKAVLERDPKNINSVKGIAYLYLQMKKFDDAKTYYRKAIDARSQRSRALLLGRRHRLDAELPAAHGRARQAGPEAGRVDHEGQGNKKVCEDLREKNSAVIEEGIADVGEGAAAAS